MATAKKKVTKVSTEVPTTSDKLNGITVTSSQVFIMHDQTMGKTKALARVMLNESLQLTGLRIVDGANGLFVAYPNDPSYKGDDYRSLFYPVTRELRDLIEYELLTKFNELLAIKED